MANEKKKAKELTAEEKKELKEKRRRKQQLLNRLKIGTVFTVLVGTMLYLLSAFVLFKINSVDVMGTTDSDGNILPLSSNYSENDIIDASGICGGDSLVLLSKKRTADTIEKALPYVGKVTVKKRIPSKIILVIEDTSAKFAVQTGDTYVLINDDLKVLGVSSEVPDGCATLPGAALESAVAGEKAVFTDENYKQRLLTLAEKCKNNGVDNITKYDLSNMARVRVVVNGRITLDMGPLNELDEKLNIAAETIEAEMHNYGDSYIIIDISEKGKAYARLDAEAEKAANEALKDENGDIEQ